MRPPVLGGFVICRPAPVTWSVGDEFGLTLMSDLHVGAAHVDYRLIKEELARAADLEDRVLINGDVFDMVLTKDVKRFTPDVLHPRLQGRRNIVNEAIEWASELLSPVAHLIDMVGCGNHETKIEQFHNFDPIAALVHELQKAARKKDREHRVHHGGYTGFVDYRLRWANAAGKAPDRKAKGRRWVLYYHHGSGQGAPVTRGLIDFNRRDTFVHADAIWLGHKHQRLNVTVQKLSCPLEGHEPNVAEVRHVATGAYFQTYCGQSQQSIRRHGRRSNYAADAGLGPGGVGGARVVLRHARDHGPLEVRVIQ